LTLALVCLTGSPAYPRIDHISQSGTKNLAKGKGAAALYCSIIKPGGMVYSTLQLIHTEADFLDKIQTKVLFSSLLNTVAFTVLP
jgi:hypothetical protein